MSLDPAAAALLAAGDYDRLGVRRSEARPRVIRHAAHQLAGPLAQQHLRAPDGPTEDALAQVVTSAYRLLDPRRRSTPTERALLAQESSGPPIAPRWVHPQAKPQRSGPLPPRSPLNRVHLDSLPCDAALFPDYMAPSPAPRATTWIGRSKRRLTAAATACLSGPFGLHRLGRRSLCLAGSLLAGLFLLGSVWLTLHTSATPVVSPHSEPLSAVAPAGSPERVNEAAGDPADETTAGEAAGRANAAASKPGEPPLLPPASGPPNAPAVTRPLAEALATDAAAPATPASPSPLAIPPPASSGQAATAPSRLAAATDSAAGVGEAPSPAGTQPAGDEAPAADEPAAAKPAGDEAPAEGGGQADEGGGKEAPERPSLPPSSRLQASQQRVQQLLADRPEAVTETQRLQQIEWLLALRDESAPASADGLAIAQLAVAKLVTIGRYRQAAAILAELEGRFDVAPTQLCLSTTEQLVDSAASLADHRRIVAWCLTQSESYLQAEHFDAATEMVRLGTISAVKLADAELRGRLNQQRDAISTARRSAEAVRAILERSPPEQASPSDAAQAGRYLCLMLRDWEQGVAWLAHGADPRLASVAQQELQLREAAAAADKAPDKAPEKAPEKAAKLDGGQLAAAWLEASARFRGRLDESSKLHAYALIQEALQQSAGLRTLELNKQLEALAAELPADRLPPATPPAAAAPAVAARPAAMPAGPANSGVMEGRLTVDGRDTGTLIRYSPGIRLGQNVIDQIFGALKQPVVPWTLTFRGVLRLEQAATVRFIAAGPSAPDGMTAIVVDRTPLTLAPSVRGEAAKLDLPAGLHQVRWQIAGRQLDEAFLLVQDEISGERLELAVPPNAPGALPARLRINIQRAP